MALFPPEFIVGLLAAFLQFRLRAYLSLASLLVNGLSFFLPPDDELIATLNGRGAGVPKSKASTPLSPDDKMQAFYIKVAKTEHGVFQQTLFYELYEMLVIIVSSTLAACCVGDVLAFARPWFATDPAAAADAALGYRPEVSVYGLVSALLVALWFPLQIKFAQGLATYEARLGLGVGALGFVLAFFVLLAPKPLFDFDMERAADVIAARGAIALRAVGLADSELEALAPLGAAARTALFAQMALLAGVFASTSFLPAFRFARMYAEMTAEPGISRAKKALLHVNMLAPLLVAALWIKPLAADVFVPHYLVPCSPRALMRDCFATAADEARFTSAPAFVLKESQFATARVYVVLASVLVRLVCFRSHLQFFLLEIRDAVVQLVRRTGAVDGALLQSKVRVQFNYLPIIAVQYLAPVASVLASALLLARQTGTSLGVLDGALVVLTRVFGVAPPPPLGAALSPRNILPDATPPDFGAWRLGDELQADKFTQFVKGMAQFTLVTPECHASLFGFFLWWLSFTWFAVSVAGLVYWKNVPHYAEVDESAALLAKRNKQTPKLLKNQLKGLKLKKQ
ncbi:hypothetical protein PybrP1_011804 [[Pythium] brassicae (nom. inval.)]|nr:hypothetical protein PybrP1_011804 [[Pythium] brassicae (nom. inval.)]